MYHWTSSHYHQNSFAETFSDSVQFSNSGHRTMLLRGLTLVSFILWCSGRWRLHIDNWRDLHWPFTTGGTSCGTSEASLAVSRVRRSSLTLRYTPYCSTTSCLAQRALGLGLLGLAAFLAIYKYHHINRSRNRRDLSQHLCSFLLLRPDEIFTNQYCYDR